MVWKADLVKDRMDIWGLFDEKQPDEKREKSGAFPVMKYTMKEAYSKMET